jgi:hypothetical protein
MSMEPAPDSPPSAISPSLMSMEPAPDSPPSAISPSLTRKKPPRAPRGHSAVTNGGRLHVVRPGDTAWARRFRDVFNHIICDLQSVHSNGLTESQRQDARRATTMIIECEKMEGRSAAGGDIDVDQYGQLTDRLGRIYRRLGLKQSHAAPGLLGQILNNGLSK